MRLADLSRATEAAECARTYQVCCGFAVAAAVEVIRVVVLVVVSVAATTIAAAGARVWLWKALDTLPEMTVGLSLWLLRGVDVDAAVLFDK